MPLVYYVYQKRSSCLGLKLGGFLQSLAVGAEVVELGAADVRLFHEFYLGNGGRAEGKNFFHAHSFCYFSHGKSPVVPAIAAALNNDAFEDLDTLALLAFRAYVSDPLV